jgi:mRNA interferase MazF
MKPERGDLVLLPFPFTELTTVKRRPAIVVSPHRINQAGHDRIVVAVSSNLGAAPPGGTIPLMPTDLASGALVKPSLILPAKIFTIHRSLVVKTLGRLKNEVLKRLLDRLRATFQP